MKYLSLYYEWLSTGLLPTGGLCQCLSEIDRQGTINLFKPKRARHNAFWGYDGKNRVLWGIYCEFDEAVAREFTPLRQNIVLLMAAMNGEL